MTTIDMDSNRLEEYWTLITGTLFLLITVDMITTIYAARIHGLEAEINPIVRWVLQRGLLEVAVLNLVALVLAVIIFYGMLTLIAEAEGDMQWIFARVFEIWLAFLLSAGVLVLANNLTVIFHGWSLF